MSTKLRVQNSGLRTCFPHLPGEGGGEFQQQFEMITTEATRRARNRPEITGDTCVINQRDPECN